MNLLVGACTPRPTYPQNHHHTQTPKPLLSTKITEPPPPNVTIAYTTTTLGAVTDLCIHRLSSWFASVSHKQQCLKHLKSCCFQSVVATGLNPIAGAWIVVAQVEKPTCGFRQTGELFCIFVWWRSECERGIRESGAGMRSYAHPVHPGAAAALLSAAPSSSRALAPRWVLMVNFAIWGYVEVLWSFCGLSEWIGYECRGYVMWFGFWMVSGRRFWIKFRLSSLWSGGYVLWIGFWMITKRRFELNSDFQVGFTLVWGLCDMIWVLDGNWKKILNKI